VVDGSGGVIDDTVASRMKHEALSDGNRQGEECIVPGGDRSAEGNEERWLQYSTPRGLLVLSAIGMGPRREPGERKETDRD
jgi:hypothetical protein